MDIYDSATLVVLTKNVFLTIPCTSEMVSDAHLHPYLTQQHLCIIQYNSTGTCEAIFVSGESLSMLIFFFTIILIVIVVNDMGVAIAVDMDSDKYFH